MPVRPKVNKIVPSIENCSIYLRSVKKWGKTTLFRDTILTKYGDPECGLLIKCGYENGDTMLDEINSVSVTNWADLKELVDWLIQEKGNEHHIKIVCFDTVDELVPIAEKQTILIDKRESNKEKTSIKAVMGGYNAGPEYAANKLIKPLMEKLRSNGFGVWAIAHTKFKTVREKGSLEEEGYQKLTSNLTSTYESAFGDIFDVTLTGTIDQEFDEKEKVGSDGKTVIQRYAKGNAVRKLYFRGTPMIDAGGRFADGAVPEYMIFENGKDNAAAFVKTVEEGMEKSKLTRPGKTKAKPVVKTAPKEEEPKEEPDPEPEEIVSDPLPEVFETKNEADTLDDVFNDDPDFEDDDLPFPDLDDDDDDIEAIREKIIEWIKNGPGAAKKEVRKYCNQYDIKVTTENDIKILKKILSFFE